MNPSVNMLPYVYDTFTWDHCLSAGFDFDDAWGNTRDAWGSVSAETKTEGTGSMKSA